MIDEFIIRIKDGVPFEHPIAIENFIAAYPDIDINNLPSEYSKFERIEQPQKKPYEVYEGVTYEFIDNIWKDVHHFRAMTQDEREQAIAKELLKPNPNGHIFDEVNFVWIFNDSSTNE